MKYQVDHFPGSSFTQDGKRFRYFGGTAYLGLQTLEAFQELFIHHIRKYGTNYGASRKSNIQFPIYEKAERFLATQIGCEASLSLSSGFLAGQLLTHHLRAAGHPLFYAPNTHVATQDATANCFKSYTTLKAAVEKQLREKNTLKPVVFLDSIELMSFENHPYYQGLQTLPLNEIIVVVDDSHGIGIVGEHGEGAFSTLKKLGAAELIGCASLGKAFGISAGLIYGKQHRIEAIANSSFFGGASPATPASMASLLDAQNIYNTQRTKLRSNLKRFHQNLDEKVHFQSIAQHPAIPFRNELLSQHLAKHHFIITNFRYPSQQDPLMSNIVISAAHGEKDIDDLTSCILDYNTISGLKSSL
ncbi:MAG: aminotransferase class I/II-fold pyridoxal phosphate-dependent enzyme [Flavobacteriaceae bacterium]|nr:aminotransferase class I/II-fold pyridoxal phosphate-dependent enzyme [Flavobacteriaceae bacterium]